MPTPPQYVTPDDLREQLGLQGADESAVLLDQKVAAAQAHIERLLGYKLDEKFGENADDLPAPIREAILQLAAWWHEQREAGIVGQSVATPPHSLPEIIAEWRDWTF